MLTCGVPFLGNRCKGEKTPNIITTRVVCPKSRIWPFVWLVVKHWRIKQRHFTSFFLESKHVHCALSPLRLQQPYKYPVKSDLVMIQRNQSVHTAWGVPKQPNSGHDDVPRKSCAMCKHFLNLRTDWPCEWTALFNGRMDARKSRLYDLKWIFSKWILFHSLEEFWIPKAGFWIPRPSIPHSTRKNCQDSGIRITLHEATFGNFSPGYFFIGWPLLRA